MELRILRPHRITSRLSRPILAFWFFSAKYEPIIFIHLYQTKSTPEDIQDWIKQTLFVPNEISLPRNFVDVSFSYLDAFLRTFTKQPWVPSAFYSDTIIFP